MMVSSKGADLFVSVRGRGPTCLVLSSIGTAPYERQVPAALDQHFTVAFVDLRGSGQSTGAAADLGFDVLAEDLEAVRAALGVGQVAVLGHSVLGILAIEHARRCPTTVSHVITAGTPPHGDMALLQQRATTFFAEQASPERKRRLQANLAALPQTPSMAQVMFAQTPLRFSDPTFDAAPLFEGAITRPEIFAQLLGPLTADWNVTAGPPLRAPLLLTHGRHDYVVPHREWDPVLPALPTATFRLFEQSGHQPFAEEPARFVAEVTAWFNTRAG